MLKEPIPDTLTWTDRMERGFALFVLGWARSHATGCRVESCDLCAMVDAGLRFVEEHGPREVA